MNVVNSRVTTKRIEKSKWFPNQQGGGKIDCKEKNQSRRSQERWGGEKRHDGSIVVI